MLREIQLEFGGDNAEEHIATTIKVPYHKEMEETLSDLEGLQLSARHYLSESSYPLFEVSDEKETMKVQNLKEVAETLKQFGQRGLEIQRYKGLGEMNPEQLWETTMDPEHRTLVKVDMQDAAKADHMFSILMGDNVEVRRTFIEDNALLVGELDI